MVSPCVFWKKSILSAGKRVRREKKDERNDPFPTSSSWLGQGLHSRGTGKKRGRYQGIIHKDSSTQSLSSCFSASFSNPSLERELAPPHLPAQCDATPWTTEFLQQLRCLLPVSPAALWYFFSQQGYSFSRNLFQRVSWLFFALSDFEGWKLFHLRKTDLLPKAPRRQKTENRQVNKIQRIRKMCLLV